MLFFNYYFILQYLLVLLLLLLLLLFNFKKNYDALTTSNINDTKYR